MQRSTPIATMLDVIAKFQDLRKKTQSLSNTKMLVSNFKNLRLAYAQLDDDTTARIDNYLTIDHQDLLDILRKSGSQLPKIAVLSGMIDEKVLTELKRILGTAPVFQLEQEDTSTTLLRKLSDEMLADSGTVKITSSISCDHLKSVLNSPNLRKVSPDYMANTTFGATLRNSRQESNIDNIINSFIVLKKTLEIKNKQKNELTPGYIELYESTMRREVNILRTKANMGQLTKLVGDLPEVMNLGVILSLLQVEGENKDEQFIAGEFIAMLLDNELIDAVRSAVQPAGKLKH